MNPDWTKTDGYREPCPPCAGMWGEDVRDSLEYVAPDPTPEQLAADGQAVLDRIHAIAAN